MYSICLGLSLSVWDICCGIGLLNSSYDSVTLVFNICGHSSLPDVDKCVLLFDQLMCEVCSPHFEKWRRSFSFKSVCKIAKSYC